MTPRAKTVPTVFPPEPALPDVALVLGGAKGVYDDLEALRQLMRAPKRGKIEKWPGWIFAVNDVACHPMPTGELRNFLHGFRLDHWCSLHPDKMAKWIGWRAKAGLPDGFVTWAHGWQSKVDEVYVGAAGGSSAMFAARVAMDRIGTKRVIWCGAPLDYGPHFDASREHEAEAPWGRSPANGSRAVWMARSRSIRNWGRSMSGWTRDLLGHPLTQEWVTTGKYQAGPVKP